MTTGRVEALSLTAPAVQRLHEAYGYRRDYDGLTLVVESLRMAENALDRHCAGEQLSEQTRDRVDAVARLAGRIDQLLRVYDPFTLGPRFADPLVDPQPGTDRVLAHLAQLFARLEPLWVALKDDPRMYRPTPPPAVPDAPAQPNATPRATGRAPGDALRRECEQLTAYLTGETLDWHQPEVHDPHAPLPNTDTLDITP